jgi:cell wall assembly regulator SMI1
VHQNGPMSLSVDESWDRIVRWLDRYAPAVAAAVGPPASTDDIAAVEAALDVPVPADLAAWWRRANGVPRTSLLPPFYGPHPIVEAMESRRILLEVQGCYGDDPDDAQELAEMAAEPAGTPGGQWLSVWLPIAGGGYELFVDLRPGPAHGCVMSYDSEGGAAPPLWPSVTAMLADVAEAMEQDRWVHDHRIWGADDGRIEWDNHGRGGWWNGDPQLLRSAYAALLAEAGAGGFGPTSPGAWHAEQILAHVARTDELLTAVAEAVLAEDPPGPLPGDWSGAKLAALITGDDQLRTVVGQAAVADGVDRGPLEEWSAAQVWDLFHRNQQVNAAVRTAVHAIDEARREHLAARATDTTARIRYDNPDAMDTAALASYAADHGGLPGLINRIEQTSARVCELATTLRDNHTVVSTRVHQAGGEVSTNPERWTGLISHHVSRHLPRHTRQLRALRSST